MEINDYLNEPLGHEKITKKIINKYFVNPIIFDIGSCDGFDSIRYSKLYTSSIIYSIEALPENFKILQENTRKFQNINVYNIALNDFCGSKEFYTSFIEDEIRYGSIEKGNKSSSLLAPQEHIKIFNKIKFNTSKVNCLTLNEFIKEYRIPQISLMHIDVQGAELNVLSGGDQIMPLTSFIWLEVSNVELYKNQPLKKDIESFFEKNNFILLKSTVNKIYGDQLYINRNFFSKLKVSDRILLRFYKFINDLF